LQLDNLSIQTLTYDLQLHILLSKISMRVLSTFGAAVIGYRQLSLAEVQISNELLSSVLKREKGMV